VTGYQFLNFIFEAIESVYREAAGACQSPLGGRSLDELQKRLKEAILLYLEVVKYVLV
jgi:hypothetical protein